MGRDIRKQDVDMWTIMNYTFPGVSSCLDISEFYREQRNRRDDIRTGSFIILDYLINNYGFVNLK